MQVTGNLVFVGPSSDTYTEVSQVQPIQGRTRYAYTVMISSANAMVNSILVELQWSNDMDNWYTMTGSDETVTSFPNNVPKDNFDSGDPSLPGEFVRLRYTIDCSSGGAATISATLSLKSN